ncbi:MAG TPA: L-glutamate gamma-semialdehyde dehydrogenase [Bryobacteraceae bacterium]|nr:L-glutamate gamma-semialdehyde dehydrogenase [Bryobacteraceae bacterium]
MSDATRSAIATPELSLSEFANELHTDFSRPENREALQRAAARVRSELGLEYDLLIGGEHVRTEQKLTSINPARPSEVVGIHQKATIELANRAVDSVYAFFPEWSKTTEEERVETLLRTAAIIRRRKLEFDAWLVYEAGKTWTEADADVSEAIDFCEYYGRRMLRLAHPEPVTQAPGESDELVYLPLGAGVIIPPWNFPLAILTGMTAAALVTGNTVVIKPSSETPTIAAKFAEVLLEAGFPPRSFAFCPGSGSVVGDSLVQHPKTRFVSFTGSRDVGLRINELAAKPQPGQIWIKRVIAEMGGKDAIVVDREADLDSAVAGVLASAFGYQGQKCSACSRAIVEQGVYDDFLARLALTAHELKVGSPENLSNHIGPVISEAAMRSILGYIEIGKREGRLICGGGRAAGDGYFLEPTIFADVDRTARIFQEEIFGPVLAVSKARNFDHALELANDTEYGLTGSVYTKNRAKIDKARAVFFVGNLYINRKCTGAMVGCHPFGGFNMSGTDSKAGGPDYLLQFVQAKSIAEKL